MNILFNIPTYPPDHNAGAEWMAKDYADAMTAKGHQVQVLTNKDENFPANIHPDVSEPYTWADVIVTHLGKQGDAVNRCRKYNKPLVLLHHNTYRGSAIKSSVHPVIVNNGYWTASHFAEYSNKQYICRPIINFDRVKEAKNSSGEYMTILNTNENKGGEIVRQAAKRLPDVQFMAVVGAYGTQHEEFTDNVTLIEHTDNIAAVLSKTRCLLMLSDYESYGRAGIEAISCGIPIIAHRTGGLEEALKDCALWTDRNDISEVCDHITMMYNGKDANSYFSNLASARFAEYEIETKYDADIFEDAIKYAYESHINN